MAPIRFVFGLHVHQPVGNFDHVFAQHVEDVYRPLLDRLAGRGFLPVALHLSGPLLEWLEASARTAGIFKIHLELRATNDGARAFYEKLGYRSAGRKSAYYDGREDAVRMTHDLAVTSTSSTERQ